MIRVIALILIAVFTFVSPRTADAKGPIGDLKIAVNSSIYSSGFIPFILKFFEQTKKLKVIIVSANDETALHMAENGEVDAVIINDHIMESDFLENGYGSDYATFAHSNFVLLGPASDPASVKGDKVRYAFFKISDTGATFYSTSVSHETYKREMQIWRSIDAPNKGPWYTETGRSLYETLLLADKKKAYALSDKFTFATIMGAAGLTLLVDDNSDVLLTNSFSIIAVNPKRFTRVRYGSVKILMEYLTSIYAKEVINSFRINGIQPYSPGE